MNNLYEKHTILHFYLINTKHYVHFNVSFTTKVFEAVSHLSIPIHCF